MHSIKTESFEGPLDLLLQLIEQEKLDITKMSLAGITDQYLSRLREIEERRPGEIADFLIIAAKLIYIKSKLILPNLDLGEEENGEDLEEQLKMYKDFMVAAGKIKEIAGRQNVSYSREKTRIKEAIFAPPKFLSSLKMKEIFENVIAQIKPILKLPEAVIKKAVSIKERIDFIYKIIEKESKMAFNSIVKNSKNKAEKVVSFLALLELVKQKYVFARQDSLFKDIIIEKK